MARASRTALSAARCGAFARWGSIAVALLSLSCAPRDAAPAAEGLKVKLAVIGDSDSHAYHDSVNFAPGSPERGGAHRAATFQWTEVLDRLRGAEVSQGAWGTRGSSGRGARIAGWFGREVRTPRKQDFEYNVAFSGHRCANLTGPRGQLAQLQRIIAADSAGWVGGIVVFRIGINDIGRREVLDDIARNGINGSHVALADACTAVILDAIRVLHDMQPELAVVLVGIADNTNWAPTFDAQWGADAVRDIRALAEAFDSALRMYAETSSGVYFLDDRSWLAPLLGGRTAEGVVEARSLEIGGMRVALSQGDAPTNAYVADGHAGTVLNTLFAQRLVRLIAERIGARVSPITDDEVATFLRSLPGR